MCFARILLLARGGFRSTRAAVGERVSMDALICEIETDKIVVEIRAPKEGVVVEQFAKVRSRAFDACVCTCVYECLRAVSLF